jgi:lipopolysaccharide heptosyltransferase II
MAALLRELRFDAAAIFTVYSQNPLPAALLCHLADIPRRLAHCRENPYQLLTDWVQESEPAGGVRHEVQRQLDLVAAVSCRTDETRLSLEVPAAVRDSVPALLRAAGARPEEPWIVVHPGASAPSRRYPAEKFAAAVRRLVAEDGWQVVLTGTAAETPLIAAIQSAAGVRAGSLGGRLSLAELAGVIAGASLLLTNNTGPSHMAAALGTPVVTLYALTNPQHTPWAVPSRVLFQDVPCRFCYKSICPEGHHGCLEGVGADEVVRAARELLTSTGAGNRASRGGALVGRLA